MLNDNIQNYFELYLGITEKYNTDLSVRKFISYFNREKYRKLNELDTNLVLVFSKIKVNMPKIGKRLSKNLTKDS